MNFKLLPILLLGFIVLKPIHMKTSVEKIDGYEGGKKKVVTKKQASQISKKEIASLTKKDFNLETVNKNALLKYLDLEEKNFEKPQIQSFDAAFKGYYKLKKEGKIDKEYKINW